MWRERVPETVVFVDVETTGLHSTDKIVSLGAVKVSMLELGRTNTEISAVHVLFDPGRKSHPRAEDVHGYSDWVLRHQDPFSDYAETIHAFLESGDLVVAHNARFDFGFIDREMAAVGLPPLQRPRFCTMEATRNLGIGSASLDSCCRRVGVSRAGARHGALEDAWLTQMVYLWLHDSPWRAPLPYTLAAPPRMHVAPPQPEGELPRRSKRNAQLVRLRRRVSHLLTMVVSIALADGAIDDRERHALLDIVGAKAQEMGIKDPLSAAGDIVAEALAALPDPSDLEVAAAYFRDDDAARAELAAAIETVARADGSLAAGEMQALRQIAALLGGAVASPASVSADA
ncbi:putative DNA-directed DNA polymerase [Hyphomicrobiales bacterium]|nr:putative DNA polymerase III epsilon subunit-like protein/uncharacterized tellurite resistance protein B-like protein [Hyphomicrobiales bacterium]CAH1667836.1 putative DNA-directed DNA polymerase [Hyphomicrobiales bacterium]